MKTVHFSILSFVLFTALSSNAAEPNGAERYTAIGTCTIDGAPAADPTAEKAMVQTMLKAGATVLDLPQVKRSQTDVNVRDLARGVVSGDLTAFEADVLVALDVRAFRDQGSALLSEVNYVRYQATIDASAISTATGQVLAVFQTNNAGLDATAPRAARNALQHAGEAIAKQILEYKQSTNRVELWIAEFPIAGLEALREALLTVPGVRGTKATHVSPALTKIDLMLDRSAPIGAGLVDSIHRVPDVGLTIVSFSDRLLRAEHGSRVKILFTHFSGKRPELGARLAEIIGTPLLDRPQLKAVTDAPINLGRSAAAREKQLLKLGLLEEDALFLTGSFFERGSEFVDVEAEIRSTRVGFDLLARDRDTCTSSKLMECTSELASRLKAKLPVAFARSRTAGAMAPPSIEITGVVLEKEIFPARTGGYEKNGIGRVQIKNQSRFPAKAGSVRVSLEGFDPVTSGAGDLAPGASLEIPIPFALNKLPEHAQTALLQLEVGYDIAGRRERVQRSERMRVLGPRAMGWLEPDSIAAFVSDPTEDVKRLSEIAMSLLPQEQRSDPVARAASLFHVLSGLRYQGDAFVPASRGEVDDVQLPFETLIRRAGDCDDFAVLYGALAHALGVRAIMVLSPSHVFPAIQSDLPAQGARKLNLDPDAVVIYQGQTFIPVETTRAGSSFREAWDAARSTIAEVKRDGLKLEVVDVRKAWETYAPLMFKRGSEKITYKPSFSGLAADLAAVRQERTTSLEKALGGKPDLSAMDARALSERAAILVLADRTEEAKQVLELAVNRFPRIPALTNNLANAHLAAGAPDTALDLYQEALKSAKAPESAVRIRLNAAIAAHVKGGADLFRKYLFDANDRATTEASRRIVAEFIDGLGGDDRLTGSDKRTGDREIFASRVRRVIEGNKYLRGQDRPARADIAEIVYWLDPEGT
jgi:tetratricopeptide (TPR) repeat protein